MRANLESARRIAQFVSLVAENAGLKAAVGLAHETPADEARATIEAQLREVHALIGYDLMAVTGWSGNLLAAVDFRDNSYRTAGAWPPFPEGPSLVEYNGEYYEFSTIPITAGGEEIGNLLLGSRFDLRRYHLKGDVALLRGGRIVRSTLAENRLKDLEGALARCGGGGGYTIRQGFRVGCSGFRGPYLDQRLAPLRPGTAVRDYAASGSGVDAEWARGR